MASTDIDGSKIVILSEAEARRVYEYMAEAGIGDTLELRLADKIAAALHLERIE